MALKNPTSPLLLVALLGYLAGFWIYVAYYHTSLVEFNFTISWYLAYGVSGLAALALSRTFSFKSSVGKFLIFSGIGLLCNVIGTLVWDVYFFGLNAEPYPSFADVFYLLTSPLIAIGLFYLLKAYKFSIPKGAWWAGVAFTIAYAALSIRLFGLEAYEPDLFIFNLLYVLNDSYVLAIALVLLFIAGGKFFAGFHLFVLGFIWYAAANILYTVRNSLEIFYFGDIADLSFVLSGALMGIGIIVVANRLKGNSTV